MAKVVIDANIIVSAAFGGNPLKAVTRAINDYEVYISESIREELTNVFYKLTRKFTKEQLAFLQERVRELIQMANVVSVKSNVTISRDPKDDHYLSLCKEVAADYLVTGDKDLLSIPHSKLKEKGISYRILTPQDFIEESN